MVDHKAIQYSDDMPLNAGPGHRSERRMGKAMPTVYSSVQTSASHHADLKLGYPHGYPKVRAFFNEDDDFMALRRFAFLHARLLVQKQAQILQMEAALEEVGRNEFYTGGRHASYPIPRRTRAPNVLPEHAVNSKGLLGTVEENLHMHNSTVLQVQSLMRIATSNVRQRYNTVGQFLTYGPEIHMNFDQIEERTWLEYEAAVRDFLRDKGTTFLKRPLDQCWMEEPHADGLNGSRNFLTAMGARIKNTIDFLLGFSMGLMFWTVLFWTGHITAALGFVLVANISGSDAHPTVDL
ncbi:MAG: hypothetical protein Q9186_003125 [Xanthomendoza sp. 1 TL-2023]